MSALTSFLAILLGALSYSMLNIGLGLEKKAAASLPNIEGQGFFKNIKNFITSKIWLLGFLLVNVQWFLFVIAVDLGQLSIVTPMMGVGLIALVLFSVFYLKEKISKKEIIAMIVLIIGIIVLGITSKEDSITYTLSNINDLLKSTGAIIFLVVLSIIIGILVLISKIRKYQFADIMFGIAGGIASGIGVIFAKGFMGGIDMNNLWISLGEAIIRWEWWIYLLLLISYNTVSTILPQIGFQKGKAVIVSPLFSVAALITPIFAGLVIFSEWEGLTNLMLSLRIISLVLIILGVILLSYYNSKLPLKDDKILEEKSPEKELTISNIE